MTSFSYESDMYGISNDNHDTINLKCSFEHELMFSRYDVHLYNFNMYSVSNLIQ